MTLRLHRATRSDVLAEGLAAVLRTPLADPFATEVVVVPAKGDPLVTPGGKEMPALWKAGAAKGSLTTTVGFLYAAGEPTRGDPAPQPTKSAEIEWTVQRGGLEASAGGGPDGSPRAIGKSLFEKWLLPFEITSLLLTGAIFGAVVLTKRKLS